MKDAVFRFDHVSFSYADNGDGESTDRPQYALSDVSFGVPLGKTTAITGRSGSGKSTILKLMAGFHESCDGTIFYRGRVVEEADQETLMRIKEVYIDLYKLQIKQDESP